MAWILAESLDRLRGQLNALAPTRSKVSDGTIGDPRHQSAGNSSDHNPRRIAGANLVTAFDATHDPAGGLDCARLRDSLIRARDGRVKYIIFNRRIISGAGGPQPWVSRPYSGVNAHAAHLHLSVVGDARCRNADPWMLPGMDRPEPEPVTGIYAQLRERNDRVMKLQRFMTTVFSSYNLYRPTGYYGLATKDGVEEFQRRTGLSPDGIVGPMTLRELKKFGFAP